MILFFLRMMFRIIRLFLVLSPVTAVFYTGIYLILAIEVIAGENVVSSLLPVKIYSSDVKELIVNTLKGYLSLLSNYSGTLMFFVLFLIMLVLAVPLFLVFISIGTFVYAGKFLIIPLFADVLIYFLRCIISGRTPFEIIYSRYRFLFPVSGQKLDKRSYDRWLRRHHDEFVHDTFDERETDSPYDDFYEEYSDDEDDYYLEDEYDKNYEGVYDEDYEDYDYDSDNDHIDNPSKNTAFSGFNFFAGCTSLESAARKYKSLVKLYHPDNMDGDTSALQEINVQYSAIKKRLSC
ncbi:hypothetical protein [Butyrivibrio sp. JL13D10]|uniref:hypothetical protein n=1 Tax=Butyrivibrio sp. JL13D10 TaxID=3236815 RepID=UPI0038B5AFC7